MVSCEGGQGDSPESLRGSSPLVCPGVNEPIQAPAARGAERTTSGLGRGAAGSRLDWSSVAHVAIHRTLDPYAEVRILDPQPEATGSPCGLVIPAGPLSPAELYSAVQTTVLRTGTSLRALEREGGGCPGARGRASPSRESGWTSVTQPPRRHLQLCNESVTGE